MAHLVDVLNGMGNMHNLAIQALVDCVLLIVHVLRKPVSCYTAACFCYYRYLVNYDNQKPLCDGLLSSYIYIHSW